MSEMHEVVAISDHKHCFSKTVFELTDIGCKCKYDTIETKVVGIEKSFRNWQFPKGKCPFKVGDIVPVETLNIARSTGAMMAYEEKRNKKKEELTGTEPEKGV